MDEARVGTEGARQNQWYKRRRREGRERGGGYEMVVQKRCCAWDDGWEGFTQQLGMVFGTIELAIAWSSRETRRQTHAIVAAAVLI